MLAKLLGLVLPAALFWTTAGHAAEPLRLGLLHTLSPAPFYIAQERGYFRDEGLDVTFRFSRQRSRLPRRRSRAPSMSALPR